MSKVISYLLGGLVGILGLPTCATASGPPVTLQLEARTPASKLFPMEALPLTITLRNVGGSVAEGLGILAFTVDSRNLIKIQRPDGVVWDVHQAQLVLEHVEREGRYELKLLPGESATSTVTLSCDWDHMKPIFTEIGPYVVRAVYRGAETPIESPPLVITVVEPPPSEIAILRAIQRLEHPEVLYEPDLVKLPRWQNAMSAVTALVDHTESSVYINYARLALAKHQYQIQRRGEGRNRASAGQTVEAILAQIPRDFILQDEVEQLRRKAKQLE